MSSHLCLSKNYGRSALGNPREHSSQVMAMVSRNRSQETTASATCVICSGGGHLAEALATASLVKRECYFVTFDQPHVRSRLVGKEVYYVVDPHVSPFLYLMNTWQSLKIFIRKQPKVVISTGAGIALATCFLAKLIGSTVIFIETGARVTSPSRTGRLIYPIADVFIVQWKPMLKHYPKAIYGGPLL